MKYIYTKLIKSFTIVTCAVSLLVFLTGCSGMAGNNKKEKLQKGCTISGSVAFEGQNTVLSSRSATTSFWLEDYDYEIKAFYNTTTNSENEIIGTFNKTTSMYSIEIIRTGTWILQLSSKNKTTEESTVIVEETITVDTFEDTTHNLLIRLGYGEDETYSSINLDISRASASTDISSVKWTWNSVVGNTNSIPSYVADWFNALSDTNNNITKAFGNGENPDTVTFNFTNVPAWAYNVCFTIEKSNGDEYFFNDVINVFQDCITNTWYGDSIQLTDDGGGNYSFILSDDLLANCQKRPFKTTETFTPYILYSEEWENRQAAEAKEFDDYGSSILEYYPGYGKAGIQVFDSISEGEKITNPLFTSKNFCFGSDCLYVVQTSDADYIINKYGESEKSYSGYSKIGNGINLSEKMRGLVSDAEYGNTKIGRMTYLNGKLYFFWYYGYNYEYNYYFSELNLTDGNLKSICTYIYGSQSNNTNFPKFADSIAVKAVEDNAYILFYIENVSGSGYYLKKIGFSQNGTELDFDTDNKASYALELDNDTYVPNYITLVFSDLMIQGDYVYALMYAKQSNNNIIYTNIEEEGNEQGFDQIICNGGVMRFKISDFSGTNVQPEIWNNNEKILGWNTVEIDNETPLYLQGEYDSVNERYEYEPISEEKYLIQPDSETEDVCFYAPRRFIAKRPEELVIADDGAYKDENSNYFPKNRVVTVNLGTQSISAVEVNVTFTTQFSSCGGSYLNLKYEEDD